MEIAMVTKCIYCRNIIFCMLFVFILRIQLSVQQILLKYISYSKKYLVVYWWKVSVVMLLFYDTKQCGSCTFSMKQTNKH